MHYLSKMLLIITFIFFQAEDGIRDYKVTGVQTCALPILCGIVDIQLRALSRLLGDRRVTLEVSDAAKDRSEERRVGKEGRDRGSPKDERKKKRTTAADKEARERAAIPGATEGNVARQPSQ